MKTGTLLRLCRVQVAARKTPNGYSLYVRFTENGKQHKQTVGFAPKNNPEAQRRLIEQAKIVAQQLDATLTASISGVLHIVSRNKSFFKFFEDFASVKKSKTRANYFDSLNNLREFVRPANDLAFGSLNETTCSQFRDFLQQKIQRADYKPSTARLHFALFKAVVNEAARRKLLPTNPAEHIKFSIRHESKRFSLTKEEIKTMLSAKFDSPNFSTVKNIFVFALSTAMRIGDVLSVRFGDVKTINGRDVLVFSMKKTKRTNVIPLNNSALAVIDAQREKALSEDSRIFHNAPSYRTVLTVLKQWSRNAIGKEVTPHILRHTAATLMLNAASVKDVSAVLGHTSIAITDRYLHSIPESQLHAVASLDRLLNARYE